MTKTSVILGSGFSRAISSNMPTMRELVEEISKDQRLDLAPLARFGNNLEQWMSFLSVEQPWLSAADNLMNRSMFLRVSERVDSEIRRAEGLAVADDPPEWLLRLLWSLSDSEAAIFTFNYDTLLERGLSLLRRASTWADLYGAPLSTRTAAASGLFLGAGEPQGSLPSIYKLHGSTNWAFGGLDGPPNDPIVMTSESHTWSAASEAPEKRAPRYRHLYDDLLPLIVPPTFSKGPYFSNRSLQAQWASGAQALSTSGELLVVGYSFPPGDLVARQWVASSARPEKVTVVDPDSSAAEKVDALLNFQSDVTHVSSLKAYVDQNCPSLVRWKVYVSNEERLGMQIDLFVDGVDALSIIDREKPPWNAFDESAGTWLKSFLDGIDPELCARAVSYQSPEGSVREARFVALNDGQSRIAASIRAVVSR